MIRYNHQKIEKKWQGVWEKEKLYQVKDKSGKKKNFYELVMFPYPSGNLHIGHWYNFAPADTLARYKRMRGYNVLFPMGFDAFGLPAENAAIQRGIPPQNWTSKNMANMRQQLRSMGAVFDWSREVVTCDPKYYHWTQWIFTQLFKAGLVYRAKTLANWCPQDRTILANEQVEDGRCERCGAEVVQKELDQWMIKITDYAEPLLKNLDALDWPEKTKSMQRNWIGQSKGALVRFAVENSPKNIEVFTTRPDTLFGVTYVVLAPEHPLVGELTALSALARVKEYQRETAAKSELERQFLNKEKTGVFIGSYVINPANGERVPVYIADYVLMHYGTGAVMAVPAHDQRDFEFAQKMRLPIKEVIHSEHAAQENVFHAFEEDGILMNSGQFDGMKSERARREITQWLAQKNTGSFHTQYRLRDWIVSRQRYWGAPIPMVYCVHCGWQVVPEKDLPVTLPRIKNYLPQGEGRSPLSNSQTFVKTKCPKCQGPAERETDTLDTFMDSAWYFFRYADPGNLKKFADPKKINAWLPIDLYIGGAEHATKHLIYARFIGQFMHNQGYLKTLEPIVQMRHQGLILGPDGQKMSKSKGNVVDPGEVIRVFGADSARMYLAFMSDYSLGGPWDPKGILGVNRFLVRVWNIAQTLKGSKGKKYGVLSKKGQVTLNQAIKKVGEDIDTLHFNTAVSTLMECLNYFSAEESFGRDSFETFIKLLAPFAPHITEEIWQEVLGNSKSIHLATWPVYNKRFLEADEFEMVVQVNGVLRATVLADRSITKETALELAQGNEKIKKHLQGKAIRKVIFVPQRLINIVV